MGRGLKYLAYFSVRTLWMAGWPKQPYKYKTSRNACFCKHDFNLNLIPTQKGTFKTKGKNYQTRVSKIGDKIHDRLNRFI